MSIPASQIVNVVPSVISGGGSALDLIGYLLTQNTRAPVGTDLSFANAQAVSSYFGPNAAETLFANQYFLGYTGATVAPGALLIGQYPAVPVAAYLRSAAVSGMTLAQLQAISGTLTVVINGVASTGTVNLSTATSFSAAAALIATALSAPVAYDSVLGTFVISSPTTGAASTIGYATGTAAAALLLTQSAGAVMSLGAAAATPAGAMSAIIGRTTNWFSFATLFDPDAGAVGGPIKQQFAAWCAAQSRRYLYAMWDTDGTAMVPQSGASAGAIIMAGGGDGTAPLYAPVNTYLAAAQLMGAIASVNFGAPNGRATMALRNGAGLPPDVTSGTVSETLEANGYNYYGTFATANDTFTFMYPGQISGAFDWIDSYYCQDWLNNQLQLALLTLLTTATSIPYNPAGYALIDAACSDPINAALNFGAIRTGVVLSQQQQAIVNSRAGAQVAGNITTYGFYLYIADPGAQVRAARGSPVCILFYADGGSVQAISFGSTEVQ